MIRWVLFFALGFFAASSQAQILPIYDDAMLNGFNGPNYSYGGGFNFDNTTQHHTGAKSISILGHSFNALAFAHVPGGVSTTLHTADTPILRFWVNGGTASGQQFHFYLKNGAASVGALLDTYVNGGGIGPGVWREVTIDLRAAPFNAADFDRFEIQSDQDAGTDASETYFDDFVLGQPAAATVNPMLIEHDVLVHTITSDRFTWRDSTGLPRVASLAHNDAETEAGSHGGALREYKYQLSNGQTRTAGVTTYGNAGYGGFGYVVSHSENRPCNGDDSPLGMGFSGTWERIFEGRHHAIFRFHQNYPRNCPSSGAVMTRYLPVTIDWMFSTGHDNPLWAVTYDVDLITPTPPGGTSENMYLDDSRAPYGELAIDGQGFTDINGVAWGDFYKFTTTNAPGTAITWNSPFNWTAANTVPYVKEWLDAPLTAANPAIHDATIGIVQTQTITQQDAGGARDLGLGSDITPYWHKTQADNVHSAGPGSLPDGNNWPYQALGNNLYANGITTNNARMTWKTQFGFIGPTSYVINNGAVESSAATAPGYPKKSYSTYIVLGQHSALPVDAQVAQVEAVQSLTLTTAGGIGSVVPSGPAGITRAANVTYVPAGYNHVYGALAFSANGSNNLDANIAVGAGTLKKPLIIVSNYTTVADPLVKFASVTLVADVDYFASVRSNASELWITLNRDLSGPTNHLEIASIVNCTAASISTQPSSTSIVTGQTATLTAAASGTATLSYQWYTGTAPNTASPVGGGTGASINVSPGSTTSYWVRVTNSCGTADSVTVTVTVTVNTPSAATLFYLVTPCRIIDTRNANGPQGGPALVSGGTRNITVAGVCGIPTGVVAISINVAVVAPSAGGYLTLYTGPANASLPLASTINYQTNRTLANNGIVRAGSDTMNVFNGGPTVHFVIDVNGYFK